MTFPTAEDFEVFEIQGNRYLAYRVGVKFNTKEEAESLKQQIIQDHEIVEQIRNEWNLIDVDTDAVEDCVKMCIFLKSILENKSIPSSEDCEHG